MTANEFRSLALSLHGATEASHMGHPDFRICGKIFATLGPGEAWGMVKLTVSQQPLVARTQPAVYEPVQGAWGRRGATYVRLEEADEASVRQALSAAWRNRAPKRLMKELGT
jgi:hypothetical protein